MTLADDLDPIPCIGMCAEVIENSLIDVLKNAPNVDDSPEEAAKKYAILGRCLRTMKVYTKEALKSVQIGSDGAACQIMEGQKHHSLSEYDDAKVSITGPDGKTVETKFGQFEVAADAIQKDSQCGEVPL